MFDFLKKSSKMDKNKITQLLKTTPEALAAFESAYKTYALSLTDELPDNPFEINAKQAAAMHEGITPDNIAISELDNIINRIVEELIFQTSVLTFDGKTMISQPALNKTPDYPVTLSEIKSLPEDLRPQLTGNLMKRDIGQESYYELLDLYNQYMTEKNPMKRQHAYHLFRQGLDILDLDGITYQIIGTNINSMGYWLPRITSAVTEQGFFQIPKTTIIKVPLTLLQLTRCDYEGLTRTTLDIVDKFCQTVFQLDENKEYFIKTGTYSSKFDFRNAYVHDPKEVRELGEYSQPCIYGVSTTNEWVVREFIPDKENNPCIYKGLPLHTEYRVFVDFDTKQVIGINPYWDPKVMKQRFGHEEDADSPHNIHDYITYSMHEETLMNRYHANKDMITDHISEMIQNIDGLTGQWSIDIMQNGDDFWLIDMALAQNSALIECVPKELRKTVTENWLPKLG